MEAGIPSVWDEPEWLASPQRADEAVEWLRFLALCDKAEIDVAGGLNYARSPLLWCQQLEVDLAALIYLFSAWPCCEPQFWPRSR